MRRLINILGYTAGIMRRHWRSTVSLIVIYGLIVFSFASVLFFIQALSYETKIVLNSIPELWVQKIVGGRLTPIDDKSAEDIEKIKGVQRVHRRIWGYYFDPVTAGVFTIIGSDTLPYDTELISGRGFRETDTTGVAICGTGYIETNRLNVGSEIILFDPDEKMVRLKIIGVFTSSSDLLTRDLIVISKNDARRLLGIENGFSTDLAIEITNPNEIETVGKKISRRLSSVRVVTRTQLVSTYESLFGYRGSLFQFGFSLSLLAFIILAWQKAGGLSAGERREIGIQKAVGWSISDILLQKFFEGAIISINATMLGLIGAYVHVFFFDAPFLKPFLTGWSVIYPSYNLIPYIELSSVLLVFFVSVIPYLAATIIPSWRAAISDPAEVMHET